MYLVISRKALGELASWRIRWAGDALNNWALDSNYFIKSNVLKLYKNALICINFALDVHVLYLS